MSVPGRRWRWALLACVALATGIPPGPARGQLPPPGGPAIIDDPSHHCRITGATVATLLRANAQAAHLFGLAPPTPALVPAYVAALRSMYPGFDGPMKTAFGDAERTVPSAVPFLSRLSPQQLVRFEAPFKRNLDDAPDEASRQVMLTQVLAYTGEHASGVGGGAASQATAASRLRQQQLLQNSMLGASRSYSPSCNVFTGTAQANPAFCQPH